MKILLAAMSMGLGGAETHVLELARGLSRMGHRVFVASAGGVYANELARFGVTHVTVPLDSKSPASVASSFARLSRLMERERFNVVHAHARIPAFICGRLRKRFGFTFVTTVHFDFRVDPLLERITDWGEHLIAVSRDLAESAVKKYGYPKENITVINNGVDTSRFCPENSGEAVRAYLGTGDKKVVMYLGRLDADSALPAETLIDAAERIYRATGAICVVVGVGSRQRELAERAEAVNATLGERAVILAGGTSDAAGYIAACDVFVGPSRSAMEALASGKPTVLAGSFGMLGAFSSEVSKEAQRTNLCCRGSELPTAERIASEVCGLLSLDGESREELARYGREFVISHYSAEAMVRECESLYRHLLGRRKKTVTLCGYYGCGNMGDELMLRALLQRLDACEDVERVFVMSAKKSVSGSKKARAIPRFSPLSLARALSLSSAIIFGGGNILQDKTSTKSLIYYTRVLSLARRYGCRRALCANGVGPILREKNMKTVKKALSDADYISMREDASARLCESLTGRKDVKTCADIAFAADIASESGVPEGLCGRDFYAVFPKAGVCDSSALTELFCKMKRERGLIPVLVPLHKKQDEQLCFELAVRFPSAVVVKDADEAEVFALLERASLAITMRLHGAVMAMMRSCPVMAVSDDGKVEAFFQSAGMPCAFLDAGSSGKSMYEAASALMAKEGLSSDLEKKAREYGESAAEELDRLCDFLTEI